MDVRYETSTNRNYLVISLQEAIQSTPDQMLLRTVWKHLAQCELRNLNGEDRLYYELTHAQSMDAVFQTKKLSLKDLEALFESWDAALTELSDHFCRETQLQLHPEQIFFCWETHRFLMIALPEQFLSEIGEGAVKLAEFVIAHVDHEEEAAKHLAYEFYADCMQNAAYPAKYLAGMRREPVLELTPEAEPALEPARASEQTPEAVHIGRLAPEAVHIGRSAPEAVRTELSEREPTHQATRAHETTRGTHPVRKWLLRIAVVSVLGYLAVLLLGLNYVSYLGLLLASAAAFLLWDRRKSEKTTDARAAEEALEPEKTMNSDVMQGIKSTKRLYSEPSCDELSLPDEKPVESDWNPTVYMEITREAEHRLYGTGKNRHGRIELTHFPFTVGKAKDYADAVLKDDSISRIHARFTKEEDGVYVEDMGSMNATFLNGMRLNPKERVKVQIEDEVSFGRLDFIYR